MVREVSKAVFDARAVCALLLCAVLTCPAAALAASGDTGNWAVNLAVGANYGVRTELEGPDVRVEYDLGLPRVKGGVARRLGEHWWLDVSLSQRKTKAEFFYPIGGGPSSDVGANDRYSSASLMASVLREFELGPWLKPYLGFGAGPTWLTYRNSVSGPGNPEGTVNIEDDDSALAYQALFGIRFPLTRRMDFGLEYEFWRTLDVSVEDVSGEDVYLDQSIHSGWLSLTYYPGAERDTGFGRARVTGPSPRGFYLATSLGVTWLRDSETDLVTFDAAAPGGLASVALGHPLGRRWRLEVEYAYQENTPQVIDFGNYIGEERVGGDMSASSFGLNLHLDPMPDAAIQPTFGIGAGVSRLEYQVEYRNGDPFVDDTVTSAHFQATVGFNIELTRAVSLHTALRFWITDRHDITLADGGVADPLRMTYAAEFGLIYRFGE